MRPIYYLLWLLFVATVHSDDIVPVILGANTVAGIDPSHGKVAWHYDMDVFLPSQQMVTMNDRIYGIAQLPFHLNPDEHATGSIIWELDPATAELTTLREFPVFEGTQRGFVAIDGNLYGTNHSDAVFFDRDVEYSGSLWSYDVASGDFTTINEFGIIGQFPNGPNGDLTIAENRLYGTTPTTLFTYDPDTSEFTTLYDALIDGTVLKGQFATAAPLHGVDSKVYGVDVNSSELAFWSTDRLTAESIDVLLTRRVADWTISYFTPTALLGNNIYTMTVDTVDWENKVYSFDVETLQNEVVHTFDSDEGQVIMMQPWGEEALLLQTRSADYRDRFHVYFPATKTMTSFVPEPNSSFLALFTGLGLTVLRRRR